jgi:hypothetical protein
MNERKVARKLGWFSLGLGVAEVVAGRRLGRALGVEDRSGLIRAFGVREIATGLAILATDRPRAAMWGRVAGDALDLAALGAAFASPQARRENLAAAVVAVGGITALDLWCARRLGSGRPHGSIRAHRRFVKPGQPESSVPAYTPS